MQLLLPESQSMSGHVPPRDWTPVEKGLVSVMCFQINKGKGKAVTIPEREAAGTTLARPYR